jgi:hypothetical protein
MEPSNWRYMPLGSDLKPLFAYKNNPALAEFRDGIEWGPWCGEAVEQGLGIGLMLEASGLVVVDCDSGIVFGRKTATEFGVNIFTNHCKSLGYAVPPTRAVHSRTKGHYHFVYTQNPEFVIGKTKIRTALAHTDIKTTGFVVDHHTAGYGITRDLPVAELPLWLAQSFQPNASVRGGDALPGERTMTDEYAAYLLDKLAHAASGTRNQTLYFTANDFAQAGRTRPEDQQALIDVAIGIGLDPHEIGRTLDSAWGVD